MSIKLHHRLLLTGAAGTLGRAMRPRLKAHCAVLRLSDQVDLAEAGAHEELVTADLSDANAVQAMVADVDAIVHLGGMSVDGPFQPILQANIVGVYHLYEAARLHGVKRVVLASSNHVTGFYPQSQIISATLPARPDSLYGVSKAFGEDLSRYYFDRCGIETACLRIGSAVAEPMDRRMLSTWLSLDDLYRLITACLDTPVLGHTVLYGMSHNTLAWWDNAPARHVGYQPQDSADAFQAAILARTPEPDPSDPAAQFQGGEFVRVGPFA